MTNELDMVRQVEAIPKGISESKPHPASENEVKRYHALVDELGGVGLGDLKRFRIDTETEPKREEQGGYPHGPGRRYHVNYTDPQVRWHIFKARVDGRWKWC